jgi:membrane protein DedA with SNARE-associated domain
MQNIIPVFENLNALGYWLIFLIAFTESIAIIGSFVPGAAPIIFMGFLAAGGYFDIWKLILFATIGAILGDCLSYYLGTKGERFFKNENRLLKASHLDNGKEFFRVHGGKSVLIARFVGIIRAIIPFVAGLSKMGFIKFLFWNILGALLWAITHLFIGYFFGGALDMILKWSHRLSYIALGILISLLFFSVFRKMSLFRK